MPTVDALNNTIGCLYIEVSRGSDRNRSKKSMQSYARQLYNDTSGEQRL
jgi:hypothetical protein